jgi:hypothetical protein
MYHKKLRRKDHQVLKHDIQADNKLQDCINRTYQKMKESREQHDNKYNTKSYNKD